MAARIGMSTGKEWVVDADVDEVAAEMIGTEPFAVIATDDGKRVYVFRAHVAYVEDEMPGDSVYEQRFRDS